MVADERICDSYYYALSMRMLSKILKNPEILLDKPDTIMLDDGIILKGRLSKEQMESLDDYSYTVPKEDMDIGELKKEII